MLDIGGRQQIFRANRGGARVEPEQSAADRLALRVNQPSPVALAGDRHSRRPACEIGNCDLQLAQGRDAVGPCPRHVLLDLTRARGRVDIGPRSDRDGFARQRESDGLDDGRAGVDGDEYVALHNRNPTQRSPIFKGSRKSNRR